MFCRSCGAQNKDDAAFCQSCGAPLSSAGAEASAPSVPQQAKKKPNVMVIGIAAVAVVVIVALVMLMGGQSEKDVVKKLVNGINKGEAKSIVALIPDEVIEESGMTKKKMINKMEDSLDDMRDEFDDMYDKWSISYKILDSEDYSKKELKNLNERYEDYYDVDIDIKAAKTMNVKLTAKFDGDTESNTVDLTVIKVGRSWYLDVGSLSYIF